MSPALVATEALNVTRPPAVSANAPPSEVAALTVILLSATSVRLLALNDDRAEDIVMSPRPAE